MPEEENERFVIEHEGEEHLFEELFRFTVDATEKTYIVLVPVENDKNEEDEEVEVFAFRLEESEGEKDVAFYPIETDEEWETVEEMIETFVEEEQD
jgi:uncharacterized protein YrzB (UPF0473 family)